jgi:hypothetical protein
VALGCVALLAGCGGGGSEDFADEATGICINYQSRIEPSLRPLQLAGYAKYLDGVLPEARRTRNRVAELEPPEDVARHVERMLENWDEILDASADLRDEAAAEDFPAALASLERMNDSDLAARDAAHDANIPACAEFAPFTSIE